MPAAEQPFRKKRFASRRLRMLAFCLLSLSLISWDKATKDIAKEHLRDKPAISFFHDAFRLQYAENTGAAMSLADDLPASTSFWVLGIAPLVILLAFLVYVFIHSRNIPSGRMFAFSLIFAGGIGNILDRLRFDRHVTDFMNLGIADFRTGIFNFADVFITTGTIFLVRSALKNSKAAREV